jgi:hypothetical protein
MKTLEITIGLPGSGKTTWSQKQRKVDFTYKVFTLDNMDKITRKSIFNNIKESNRSVIVDSLITTQKTLIDFLTKIFCESNHDYDKIILHIWNEDRESCLWNDRGRRKIDSAISINNMPLDDFDLVKIKEKIDIDIDIDIKKHIVMKKEKWEVFADEMGLYVDDSGKMRSSEWSLGGSWANCWGDSGSVSGEAQPASFKEFDSLLEKVCPDISFLKYKNLMNTCVTTDEYNEGDYYGGNVTYGYFELDVIQLYKELEDSDLYHV